MKFLFKTFGVLLNFPICFRALSALISSEPKDIGSRDIKALKARKLIVPQTWNGYSAKKGPIYAPKRKKIIIDLTRDDLQR
ncbi:phenylalanine--tRNA ligase alpha subunit, cytoplasmic [Trifolium repens]|nr:phenylalanine--tRNA ligase alpha subunit, cytoplasmic [Trifolium repens]